RRARGAAHARRCRRLGRAHRVPSRCRRVLQGQRLGVPGSAFEFATGEKQFLALDGEERATMTVIKFAPRAAPLELPLEFVELRLGDDCSVQMTLYDDARNVVAVLEFT